MRAAVLLHELERGWLVGVRRRDDRDNGFAPLPVGRAADHWPLACTSGPSASDTNCKGGVSPGGRNGRSRCAGFSRTDATIAAGSVIGAPPGFPPPSAAKKMSSCRQTTPFGSPVVPPV